MRRSLFIVAFVACFGLSARAYEAATVAQLESIVSGLKGKTDSDCGRRISGLRLSERLSSRLRVAVESAIPGDRCRQALRVLADASQFLPPPANEIQAQPAPDIATQRQIVGRVVAYVSKTVPQLPNFLATQETARFEDMPQRRADYVNKYEPLHPVARASAEVTYQDGREVVDTGAKTAKGQPPERGLTTWGEFGPILSTVLLDAARNKLAWLRWERGEPGLLAVFAYSVPKEGSHYEIDYCCVQDSEGRTHMFHELEGYAGEMTVDPATGTIMRLMVKAQMKAGGPVNRADLVVEYGPVEIGGKSYICPVRSIALSRAQSLREEQVEMVQQSAHGQAGPALAPVLVGSSADVTQQTLLNEAAFTNYHVFRAEPRIVSEAPADLPQLGAEPAISRAGAPEPAAATANSASAAPDGSLTSPAAAPAGTSNSSSVTASTPAPPSAPPLTSPVAEPAEASEIVATAAAGVQDLPAAQQAPLPNTGFTLRTTSRLVDVPVVAFDKKGRPVTDLKPNELEVYDNGRKQKMSFFSQAGLDTLTAPATKPAQGGPETEQAVSTNRSGGTQAASTVKEAHTTILLIDSSNVAFFDLSYARQEILRFLKTVPADERVGLYILHSYGFQILLEPTDDHAQVAAKLTAWMPSAQDLLQAQHEEDRNRQNMEYVQHASDLLHVNGNTPTGEYDSLSAADPQLRSLGDNPARNALAVLQGVARRLGAIPGHKSLVWVASDNVLADFSEKAPDNERGDKNLDPLALRARETLNEAHVSIYPLDVSQLEAGGVSAEQHAANVQLKPTSEQSVVPPGLKQEVEEARKKSQRDIYPGRVTAKLQQDTHPIQGIFRDLAEATGGRALRRAGDIATELNSIVADGRAAYLLGFTPDTQADGKYHALAVKCLRSGVTLRYRNGYLYSAEPATMKDRFREAVWQPRDENEIGLTAATVKEANGPAVRLNIAATDLEMAQKDNRWTDNVDVFVVVRDDSALHAAVAGKRLGLALLPATYQRDMNDGLVVEESLPKRPEGALVRLIVIDENSRRMGSVTLEH